MWEATWRALHYWGLPLALVALVFLFSSMPGPRVDIQIFPHADKVAHAMEFGALALALVRALVNTTRWQPWLVVGLSVAFAAAYGVLDEYHQSFVPGRDADAWDVMADMVGGMMGCGVWYAAQRFRSRGRAGENDDPQLR